MKNNKDMATKIIILMGLLLFSISGFATEQMLRPVTNTVDMIKFTIIYLSISVGVIVIIYQAYSVVFDEGSVKKLGGTFIFVAIALCAPAIVEYIKAVSGG